MLKRLTLIALLLAALAAPAGAEAASLTQSETTLLRQMNLVRVQHGLGRLSFDPRLERAARAHTRRMLATGTFAHGAFASRMSRFDVIGSLTGENLAWGTGTSGTPSAVVAAWLASPEHRANLLRPMFTRVGVGSIAGTFAGYRDAQVVTADFAG